MPFWYGKPTPFWSYALFVALTLMGVPRSLAAPLEQWSWCNPLPQGNPVNNLVNANGIFIALGPNGLILTSPDGTNWVHRTSESIDSLNDCVYGDGLFVIVGEYGTVLTSADTINWSVQYTPTFYDLYGVTYGNGRFVAVGEATTILTSENGTDWTRRIDGPWRLHDVTWGGGVFVAVGGISEVLRPSEGTILVSSDAQSWTRSPLAAENPLTSVTYGDGRFAASMPLSFTGRTVIWNSTDGLLWKSDDDIRADVPLGVITYRGGRWLASGSSYGYAGQGRIYTSQNLTTWSLAASNISDIVAVAYKDGLFAAAGRNGTTFLSRDATNWANPHSELRFAGFNELTFLHGRFFATGYAFENHYGIAISDDGCEWSQHGRFTNEYSSGFDLLSLAYANGLYVAGGEYRTVWVSTDGLSWSNPAPDLRVGNYVAPVSGIAYGKGLFVATGGFVEGDMLVSSNGIDWAVTTNATNGYIRFDDVTFGVDRFVASGSGGHLAVSSDGTNWLVQDFGYPASFPGITYGDGKFVAVGPDAIATSSDGTNWTIQLPSDFGSIQDIAFGNGWFVAVGADSSYYRELESPIWVSPDGMNWSPRRSRTSRRLSRVTFGNGTFVIAGEGGAILSSDPVVKLSFLNPASGQLTISGPANRQYRVDWAARAASTAWSPLMTITAPTMPLVIMDPEFATGTQKYYRAVLLPE